MYIVVQLENMFPDIIKGCFCQKSNPSMWPLHFTLSPVDYFAQVLVDDTSSLETIKKKQTILRLIFPRAYLEYKICCLVSV